MNTHSAIQTVPNGAVFTAKTAVFSGILKDGGSLFLRVAGKNADGSFAVFAKGLRFNVSSTIDLQKGQSFTARITLAGSTIYLTPEPAQVQSRPDEMLFMQQLAQQNIPLDALSTRLMHFFMQLGVRIDTKFMQKARALAASFSGKEEEAAEVALLLIEKGMEPSVRDVSAMLSLLNGENAKNTNLFHSEEQKSGGEELKWKTHTASSLQNIYKKPIDELSDTEGLLTLANHCKTGEKHWIVLPYVLPFEEGKSEIRGNIRILLDTVRNTTEKMCIYARIADNDAVQWFFSVDFSGSMQDKKTYIIQFCASPEISCEKRAFYEESFKKITGNFFESTVHYTQSLLSAGFFSSMQEFQSVSVEA